MAEPSTRSVLEAHGVSRRYGRRWVLRHVDAAFQGGTVTAVTGANGAGKSTLLAVLCGASRPTEGEVRLSGLDLHGDARRRQRIAVLSHQPWIYPELSALENLRFFARLHGRAADDAHLRGILERVDLASTGTQRAGTFSRGMSQRLGLGRVLSQGADVWLLDEPTTGLDPAGRELLLRLVADARAAGTCIVWVTHDLARLGHTPDQVFHLQRGRAQERGAA